MNLIRGLIFLLLVLFVTGCSAIATPEIEIEMATLVQDVPLLVLEDTPLLAPDISSIPFAKVGWGMSCGWVDFAGIVIKTQKQLEWFWDRFYQFSLRPPEPPDMTEDFETIMWICVFRGLYSTWGYTIDILRISKQQDAHGTFLRVEVMMTNPSPWLYVKQEFSQPFHIVRLARRDRPVHFTFKERIRWR